MLNIPPDFIHRTKEVIGEQVNELVESLKTPCRTSIRLNPLKKSEHLKNTSPIPWTTFGYYLGEKPKFTLDPYFHAGYYYVQEANSMIIEKAIIELFPSKKINVLDLCAAPGGKSTHLHSILDSSSVIHSHEVNTLRVEILRQNIEKWGPINSIVTTGSIKKIVESGLKYDVILLDAPCSGEGMFRKEEDAIKQWNLNKINHCVFLQNEIVEFAHHLLSENGILIYSTCTYNREENEDLITRLIKEYNYESIQLKTLPHYNLLHTEFNRINTYRALPHRMEGEGFTFSILRKTSDYLNKIHKSKAFQPIINSHVKNWLNFDEYELQVIDTNKEFKATTTNCFAFYNYLSNANIRCLNLGISVGHFKGKDWFPAQGLATNIALNKNIPLINLELDEALHYLRADGSYLPSPILEEQWQIIAYNNAPLGWVKKIGSTFKNYYPKNMRIHSL